MTRILHKDLGMMPYKVQLVQELKPIDHPMRLHFAKWACDRLTEDANFGTKKNHLFILILADMFRKQAKLSLLGHKKTRTHTLNSRHTQNESLFGADIGPEA